MVQVINCYELKWDPRINFSGVHVIIDVGSAYKQLSKIYNILW